MHETGPLPHIVLMGLMGSGKTSVGRLLAARLARPFSDSDADIEAVQGASAREIRERSGSSALHELEARHLLGALDSREPSVIAAAASTIEDGACRGALRDGRAMVVWLTARPETAAERFDDQAHRPRYGVDTGAFLARQATERGRLFRSVNPVELATDDRSPDDLARAIAALLADAG